MSRFYVTARGNRGEASRQGSEKSGIVSHTRGYDVGIQVAGFVNDQGEDCFHVYLTGGSNGYRADKLIGTYTKEDLDDNV